MTKSNGGTPPKLKIPLDGGSCISVWENWREISNTTKKKLAYAITIQNRRYQDPQTGDWKTSQSLSPAEAAAVAWGIGKALDAIIALQSQEQTQEPEVQDTATPPF